MKCIQHEVSYKYLIFKLKNLNKFFSTLIIMYIKPELHNAWPVRELCPPILCNIPNLCFIIQQLFCKFCHFKIKICNPIFLTELHLLNWGAKFTQPPYFILPTQDSCHFQQLIGNICYNICNFVNLLESVFKLSFNSFNLKTILTIY